MAKRAGWANLSPETRERYKRNGITKRGYDRGESLKKARGHEKTPERPSSYDPKQYPQYHANRQKLYQEVARKKQEVWGTRPKWNPIQAAKNVEKAHPTVAKMQQVLDWDEGEWYDAITEDPAEYWWLGYE